MRNGHETLVLPLYIKNFNSINPIHQEARKKSPGKKLPLRSHSQQKLKTADQNSAKLLAKILPGS